MTGIVVSSQGRREEWNWGESTGSDSWRWVKRDVFCLLYISLIPPMPERCFNRDCYFKRQRFVSLDFVKAIQLPVVRDGPRFSQ